MGHQLSVFLTHYGLLALFLLVFVKAVGVPIPVPADLIVIAAATGSAGGKLVPWQAFGVILVAMIGGAIIQFALARGPGRQVLYRFGPVIGLTPQRLDLAFQRVENVGIGGIAVAVVTPGIRTAAIPACGLTTISVRIYVIGLTLGTSVYVAFQFFVAYGLLKLGLRFWNVGGHLPFLLLAGAATAALALLVVRHRTRHLTGLHGSIVDEDQSLRSNRCPLCWLTVGADRLAGGQRRRKSLASVRSDRRSPGEGPAPRSTAVRVNRSSQGKAG